MEPAIRRSGSSAYANESSSNNPARPGVTLGRVGDLLERAYCLRCRAEIMTEAGQLCDECGTKDKDGGTI